MIQLKSGRKTITHLKTKISRQVARVKVSITTDLNGVRLHKKFAPSYG